MSYTSKSDPVILNLLIRNTFIFRGTFRKCKFNQKEMHAKNNENIETIDRPKDVESG